jgi:hypothetical protein
MGDSQRGRSGVGYEKGFGGHRERKGLEEEGGGGSESDFLDLSFLRHFSIYTSVKLIIFLSFLFNNSGLV